MSLHGVQIALLRGVRLIVTADGFVIDFRFVGANAAGNAVSDEDDYAAENQSDEDGSEDGE
jgi:hypothetical protein